jgi:hypothetical protein
MTDARPWHLDRILSVSAAIAAVTAVAISLYQAALARQQLRASAWPYVAITNSYVPGQPYTRTVTNQGVGPARVRSVHMLADGQPVFTWNDVVRKLTGEGEPGLIYSSLGRGNVLAPGVTRNVLTLPAGPRAEAFWQAAQTRLVTVVCFCSIYDECWNADTRRDEPAPVPACPVDTTTTFRE